MARSNNFGLKQFALGLDHLIATVAQGRTCVLIARRLGNLLHTHKEFEATAPTFWHASGSALSAMAQLWAFKLCDDDGGALTVQQILKEAHALKHEFPNAASAQVEAIIKIANNKIAAPTAIKRRTQIRKKRNNLIAHLNRRIVTAPSGFASGLIVRWSDIEAEFDMASSILTDLTVVLCNRIPSFEVPGSEDYKNVVLMLAKAIDAETSSEK